jgi:non-specific protein-tyrosine kinase
MELRQYIAIARRWVWLVVLGLVLGALLAFVNSRLTTRIYSASTTLLVSEARGNPTSDYTGLLTSERLAQTYSQMLRTSPVLNQVAANLKMPSGINGAVSVQIVNNTQLIRLSVESADPQAASDIANEIPKVFSVMNVAAQTSRFAASRQNLQAELANLDDEIAKIQSQIIDLRNTTGSGVEPMRAQLDSELAQLRQSRASVMLTYEQLRVTEAQAVNNIVVVEPAIVPTVPIRPNTTSSTVLGGAVGLLLAVGLVFMLEYLDDTLKTPDDIAQHLGLTTLGTILRTRASERNKSLVAIEQPKTPFAEAFRTLRTNIQFSSVDKPIKTVMVTSAGPGEGKSTLAANLAVVMAQSGLRTVLIDCDLRRPSIHKIFSLPNQQGITTALLHELTALNGEVRSMPVEHLRVIPSGPIPPNPSELVGSRRMTQLLDTLAGENDFVIIDSPPALAVTDASILARKVDGVILVIESGATRRTLALKAKAQLEQVGAHVLGATLNKLSARTGNEYYYYYTHYNYTSDEGKQSSQRSGRKGNSDVSLGTRLGNSLARLRK